MLIEPSVDEILNKVDSRYELVHLASKRARDIIRSGLKGDDARNDPGVKIPPLTEDASERAVSQAAKEIANGLIIKNT